MKKKLGVVLLYPFAIVYHIVTSFRNYLYNKGLKKSQQFEIPIINIGNLTVGGTGKTPHVEYLIKLLRDNYNISTLSRGYGRETNGFLLASENCNASIIGDEPMQFYRKFKNKITVAVGEERALAIPSILYEKEETNIIILDDAYQHRKVIRDLNMLLSDYNIPFYEDFLLPAGRLRESRSGAKRADVIIVSKCPSFISPVEQQSIINKIRKYSNPDTPVFFTTIKYSVPEAVFDLVREFKGKVLLVSGIARPAVLEKYVRENYNFYHHIKFSDHHHYSEKDIEQIVSAFQNISGEEKSILTTEKDMVKWQTDSFKKSIGKLPVFYLPIEVEFVTGKDQFEKLIFEAVDKRLLEVER